METSEHNALKLVPVIKHVDEEIISNQKMNHSVLVLSIQVVSEFQKRFIQQTAEQIKELPKDWVITKENFKMLSCPAAKKLFQILRQTNYQLTS
jgi:hypothetical protein